MAGDASTSSSKRVLVRDESDYDAATTPSFEVEYADIDRSARNGKFRKNPLVPLGAVATAAVLAGGLFHFKKGNAVWSQRLMRARILTQGVTLGILALSVHEYKSSSTSSVVSETSDSSSSAT
jgi:hypothetical protein